MRTVKEAEEVRWNLEFIQSKPDCCLVIDGESLQVRSPSFYFL
jgi:phospholipid-translocating ATPase